MKNKSGVIYAILAYTIWGLLPLYWNLLSRLTALELLSHRVIWSCLFVSLILVISRRIKHLKAILADKQLLKLILGAAILITINWGIYIWSVTSGHIIEASMGYYIEPLFMVVLGLLIFKEKLNLLQIIALVLAVTGVLILITNYGEIPWVSLTLAISFGLYGMLKKKIDISPLLSLALESAIITPFALLFLISRGVMGANPVDFSPGWILLMIGVGPATAIPLLLFAEGARRIKMSTLGFTQYISPTISLFLGIYIYKEVFTITHLISFIFIWCGLFIYTLSLFNYSKRRQKRSKSVISGKQNLN